VLYIPEIVDYAMRTELCVYPQCSHHGDGRGQPTQICRFIIGHYVYRMVLYAYLCAQGEESGSMK